MTRTRRPSGEKIEDVCFVCRYPLRLHHHAKHCKKCRCLMPDSFGQYCAACSTVIIRELRAQVDKLQGTWTVHGKSR